MYNIVNNKKEDGMDKDTQKDIKEIRALLDAIEQLLEMIANKMLEK